jgi:ComF family protein
MVTASNPWPQGLRTLLPLSHHVGSVGRMWFERRCAGCDRPGASPCDACLAGLRPPSVEGHPAGLDSCRSLFDYDERGRDLVMALKYRNRRDVAPALAVGMAQLVDPVGVDVVTWAPTSALRRAARGYDQSRLLAVAVARALGRPCRRLLRRSAGAHQTGLTSADRLRGPTFTVRVRPAPRVLVVDDVVTTGATLSAAGRALRAAGALDVHGLTAARTPLKLGRARDEIESQTGVSFP